MNIGKAQEVSKAIVAAVGSFLAVGSQLIPVEYNEWIGLVLALGTAFATYQVPNQTHAETVGKRVAKASDELEKANAAAVAYTSADSANYYAAPIEVPTIPVENGTEGNK